MNLVEVAEEERGLIPPGGPRAEHGSARHPKDRTRKYPTSKERCEIREVNLVDVAEEERGLIPPGGQNTEVPNMDQSVPACPTE